VNVAINEPKYSFEPSDFRCLRCSGEIPAETSFYSAISFEAEAFRRRSFCLECWKSPGGDPIQAYAFWRTRRPAPLAPQRRIRFDQELILEFFRRLGKSFGEDGGSAPGREDPPAGESRVAEDSTAPAAQDERVPEAPLPDAPTAEAPVPAAPPAGPSRDDMVRLRLVLALLLIRKKVLVFESSGLRDGREWLKLSEKAEPQRAYLVENPPLSDAQLEAVKVSLGELLQMEI